MKPFLAFGTRNFIFLNQRPARIEYLQILLMIDLGMLWGKEVKVGLAEYFIFVFADNRAKCLVYGPVYGSTIL